MSQILEMSERKEADNMSGSDTEEPMEVSTCYQQTQLITYYSLTFINMWIFAMNKI